jgi:DUF4097 and DUF4098 domain-containing protein YvlB
MSQSSRPANIRPSLAHLAAVAGALAVALAASPAGAFAQRSDSEWMENCRDRDRWSNDRDRFCEIRDMGMRPPSGTLTVDPGQNGGVYVEGWNRDSVAIVVRIRTEAETESEARDMAKEIKVDISGGTIRAIGPERRSRSSWSVEFDIMVPRKSALDIETHNGPIGVTHVTGRIDVRAVNGPIKLTGVGGDVRGRTSNGPMIVELEGKTWEGAGLDAVTTNGPVTLEVPEDYSAELETGTTNGPMRVDFPITVQGRFGRRLNTKLGAGGSPVRVVTTNGPVVIRRP